ncbi:MAG: hypothetical protein SFU86_18500 [Pirellulaceae bacterium]|nr:hypothetical protein [Pirellulaceae bacterium]
MPSARLIVCEKTGHWAGLFRRALAGREVLAETRSLAECGRQLGASPASVVAVEVTAGNLEAILRTLPRWSAEYARARFLALTTRELAAAESLLREAGTLAVLQCAADVPLAVRLAHRHLALAPAAELPWREALLARLPWASLPRPAG